ncbi:hypothetical protein B7494_g2263 [Chlorociboria aeruginascens]|nr:hypothetical protein B7494_g2263 [Chlorociboria aeruginascens]
MSASEASTLQSNTPVPGGLQSTTNSKIPLLGEGFQETPTKPLSKSADNSDVDADIGDVSGKESKSGKRRLFGFGKKKDDDKTKSKKKGDPNVATNIVQTPIAQPTARRAPQSSSPSRSNQPYQTPSSPPNRKLFSSSPGIVSPAGSQIFERDVQESTLAVPNSPAIPSHIQTENHIPPVLDASSQAITNNTLDPDTVEIIMHSSHQSAAVNMTGVGNNESTAGTWADDLIAHPDKDDAASNYGALDSADVRRLSFISFADVVQSEHAEHAGNRDSIYIAGLSALSSPALNRSPSPVRSPVSSPGLGTSPPTSKSASVKGIDLSPGRGKPLGSPTSSQSPTSGGELTIETMSQALRRTGSGDLTLSPVSPDGLSDLSYR